MPKSVHLSNENSGRAHPGIVVTQWSWEPVRLILAGWRFEEDAMLVEKFHHVAFRCRDAKETVDFYRRILGMELIGAIAEDRVPSTGEPDPYMHIFLDAGGGAILAFFELPNSPPMGRDPNTPAWTQHIAFQAPDLAALDTVRARCEKEGI